MRAVKQTAIILSLAVGIGLMREGWEQASEGLRGLIAGLSVGLVVGSVGTLMWLSFSPEPEAEDENG